MKPTMSLQVRRGSLPSRSRCAGRGNTTIRRMLLEAGARYAKSQGPKAQKPKAKQLFASSCLPFAIGLFNLVQLPQEKDPPMTTFLRRAVLLCLLLNCGAAFAQKGR